MIDETNVLIQQAEDTGFLQDVVAVLKAFGIDDKDAWLIGSSISAWSYTAAERIGVSATVYASRMYM